MSWLSELIAAITRVKHGPARPKPVPVTALKFTSQVVPIVPFSAAEVVSRHNAERARAGLHPLDHDGDLDDFAGSRAAHAASVNLTIDHVHDGFVGISGAGTSEENAAMGQVDAPSVMADWMSSPGHRANIMSTAVSSMGAGRATSADLVTYWYTCFTG